MIHSNASSSVATPWNKGRLTGQKPPLKLQEIWGIRYHLEDQKNSVELALFNLAIDSKLRGCDVVRMKVRDVRHGDEILSRSQVVQRKTGTPVKFEITEKTRSSLKALISADNLGYDDYLFRSKLHPRNHMSTRQYARIVHRWVEMIGLDSSAYGTHSLRRTKATLIYRKTRNIRAVQLLLGHTKLDSTVRYLGIDVEDALEISEKIEV